MKEDIIRMAREVGLRSAVILHLYGGKEGALCDSEIEELAQIERFFHMAQAAEREACAKLIDEAKVNIWEFHPHQMREAAHNVCTNLAAAIRARGQS
jgi:hypothetical protein